MNNEIMKNAIASDLFISQNCIRVTDTCISVKYNNHVYNIKHTEGLSAHDISRFILSKES